MPGQTLNVKHSHRQHMHCIRRHNRDPAASPNNHRHRYLGRRLLFHGFRNIRHYIPSIIFFFYYGSEESHSGDDGEPWRTASPTDASPTKGKEPTPRSMTYIYIFLFLSREFRNWSMFYSHAYRAPAVGV